MNTNLNKSIVVLPFLNLSQDQDNEFFADGMTEEIINALAKVEGLKVIARTSSFAYKGKHIDVRKIGEELGVSSILEGSIRKSSKRLRITAQLISAEDGTHYWSENYNRELTDVFELQDEISLKIAEKIRENYGHFEIQDHLVSSGTKNILAYENYLKGRYEQLAWTPDSIKSAITFYQKSVETDPKYALPYYGLVQCFGLLAAWGYMPAEEGFETAIHNFLIAKDIDDSLPEYHLTFVGKSFWGEWDFSTAYDNIKATLNINPYHSDALEAMAELMIAHGKFNLAVEYIEKALVVDPLSANHHYTYAHINYYSGNFQQALTYVNKSIELNPSLTLAKELRLLCLIWLNDKEQFDIHYKGSSESLANVLFSVMNEDKYQLPKDADQWIDPDNDESQLVPYEIFILANSGNEKLALDYLKKYILKKRGQVINFRVDPLFKSLHKFEEFHNLHISNLEFSIKQKKVEPEKNKKEPDKLELRILTNKLLDYLRENQPHLDPQMTLVKLAKEINVHPNKLSFLINEEFKINYNEFINGFRLKEFKEKAVDKKYKHLSLLGLAFECGFNSKTVFNTYFKRKEGMSPKEWVKIAQN
jgi:TolB-like protein/AraC-like DNA-binding protein